MKERAGSKLGEYQRKRRPEATNEPFGGEVPASASEGTLSGAFVMHLHDATRRHYDLRLEVDGVLASFAVPRGPSLDPDEKVLAVRTEDHPLEYLDFEDVIPPGQYGAGAMIVWDRGSVRYLEGPAAEEIANGKIHVELRGLKLRGRYALVKLAKPREGNARNARANGDGNQWLLFKKADAHASKERDIAKELPCSVLSGLTVDELPSAESIGRAHAERALERGAKRLTARATRELFAPSSSPLIHPRGGVKAPPDAGGWLYDAELDGVRVLAAKDGDVVSLRIWTAAGAAQAIEHFYPDVVRALQALPASRLVLDAELVAFDASGHPSSKLLAQRAMQVAKLDTHRATTLTPVALVAKDLLTLGDADTRNLRLDARRALLAELLPAVGVVRAAPPLEGARAPLLALCAELGVSRVVAKKSSSLYSSDPKKSAWVSLDTTAAPQPQLTIDHLAADASVARHAVVVTNRTKVFWPDEGYSKGDLCDYYASVADAILPYLANRPVILVRYPDGVDGKSFFQWRVPHGMPPWIRTLPVGGPGEEAKRGFLVEDAATLLYIANLGCIPVHILGSRLPRLDHADFFTIDFDVKQSSLANAVTLARRLHEHLDAIGLPSFPKTSGQSGLHVLVPLGAGQSFTTARALAELLGKLLVEEFPDAATMERVVARRGTRVYVDTGQTGPSRAIVAPYSVRAVPGATVSTPLAWEEVDGSLDPRAFTIKTVPGRLAKHGDPMRKLLKMSPDVAQAVERLSDLVERSA